MKFLGIKTNNNRNKQRESTAERKRRIQRDRNLRANTRTARQISSETRAWISLLR